MDMSNLYVIAAWLSGVPCSAFGQSAWTAKHSKLQEHLVWCFYCSTHPT